MMPPSNPRVSVVLPTHDRARELPRAVHSVLGQSYRDLELIVVDDASTDDTADVLAAIDDERLRVERHDRNRGGAAARNTGVAAARGELIAFQDSDDEWLPTKLARQVERLDAAPAEVGAVYCPYTRRDPDGTEQTHPAARITPREGDLHAAIVRESFIGTPTLVVRRACLDRIGGFDERLPRLQDWELMIRLSAAYRIAIVDEVLVVAHTTGRGITSGHDDALVDAERHILNEHWNLIGRAGATVRAHRAWHLAHVLFMRGRMREGRRWLRRALGERLDPRHLVFYPLSFSPPIYRTCYRMWNARRSSGA